jgi:hypothetical protein
VPAGSGWRDPEIEASDVLACGGLVPERCREGLGLGAEIDNPTGVVGEASEPMEPAGVANATPSDGLADGRERDDDELAGPAAGGDCDDGLTEAAERADGQIVRNEPKFDENVNITQTKKSDDFIAKSGVDAGLDNFETKPSSGGELSREAAAVLGRAISRPPAPPPGLKEGRHSLVRGQPMGWRLDSWLGRSSVRQTGTRWLHRWLALRLAGAG